VGETSTRDQLCKAKNKSRLESRSHKILGSSRKFSWILNESEPLAKKTASLIDKEI